MKVVLYSKKECGLCDDAKGMLQQLSEEFEIELDVIDIYSNEHLLEKYQLKIPVVEINGKEAAFGRIQKEVLRKRLTEGHLVE